MENKMERNYREDQINEVEALDSIYCGELESKLPSIKLFVIIITRFIVFLTFVFDYFQSSPRILCTNSVSKSAPRTTTKRKRMASLATLCLPTPKSIRMKVHSLKSKTL